MDARSVPNFLLVRTDQQRRDTLGCYGNAQVHTPVLDALAAEGAVFEQCYVQNPICSPSRASLFTGMHARNHGLWANGVALPDHQRMFTRVLADAGYDCGMIGKQHLSPCEGCRSKTGSITGSGFSSGCTTRSTAHHGTPIINGCATNTPPCATACFRPRANPGGRGRQQGERRNPSKHRSCGCAFQPLGRRARHCFHR